MNISPSPLEPTDCSMLYKVIVSKNRKGALTSTLYKEYGADIIAIPGKEKKHSFLSNGRDIMADLLKGEPPKQWLQKQIDEVEEEEGLLIANVIKKYGQQGKDFIKTIAYEHGMVTGWKALESTKPPKRSVIDLYRLLDEYFLDGWPDQYSKKITQFKERVIVCHHSCCVHLRNWQKAEAPFEDMCEISGAWIEGFCRAFSQTTGETIEYKRKKSLAWGDPFCEEVFQQN